MDLNSKHGTEVNHTRLLPYKPVMLKQSDKISLANGMVIFYFSPSVDETMDLTPVVGERIQDFELNPVKQTLKVHDTHYKLSEKEYKCLELLLSKQNQFISQEEVKKHVWPERICLPEDIPNVGSEELAPLIYRIRKRTCATLTIESIRGKGYILHLNTSLRG
jgi:two-component system, OmpR family, response regulator QseB